MDRVILWDFDGTLAFRPGRWGGCLVETLDEHEPGHGVDVDAIRPFLRDGFPWHRPETPHPELCDPEAWWAAVEGVLTTAYAGAGVPSTRARELAGRARRLYVDPSRGWRLFEDTIPVLAQLREEGWTHAVLSNHVPELGTLVDGLGLGPLVEVVLSSAVIGYEKPNRRAFELALETCGRPACVWMVGDNPIADVDGAEQAGISAILVRAAQADRPRATRDLYGVEDFVRGPGPPGPTIRSRE